ncbi:SGNH/GDSL hydrolase family protein [Rubrivirga sp. IMCC43871]|uniref:SGNH/GDSL hydrolase family protein n=1 Tax=Rubrivirga sp. IMCC43871 TaxID=3391575 RepID=UPI00398FCF30
MTRTFLLVALGLVACSAGPVDRPPADDVGVLFVGNSLTYTHDLPEMVKALVPTLDGVPVRVGAIALPNVSLEDHWGRGDVQAELASGAWDVVVMQQGPSSLPQNQAHLAYWAGEFAALARSEGVQPALLGVWPPEGSEAVVDAVITAYANAAAQAEADLFPAGAAWKAARAADTADPYGPDRFHPSPAGSYLAALTVAGGLTDASTVGLPAPAGLDAATVRALQGHADAALDAVDG